MIRKLTVITAILLTTALAGCSETAQDRSAGTGALVGAAGGALVGQALGGDTKSTVIGAAGGALLGAALGTATAPRGQEYCRYRDYNSGRVYEAPCDDRYYSRRGY